MRLVLILTAAVLLLLLSSCPREIEEDTGIRRYQITENIANPPDSFLLLMPLSNTYSVKTFLKTDTNAVWKIAKENAANSSVWMTRSVNDPNLYYLKTTDTVGIESGVTYEIYGNNNMTTPLYLLLKYHWGDIMIYAEYE